MPQREKPRLTIRRPPPPAVVDSFVNGVNEADAPKNVDDGSLPSRREVILALPEEISSKLTDICAAEGIDVDAAVREAVSAWIEADPLPQRFDW